MDAYTFLDVAIGLALVYLLTGLMCSALGEVAASALKIRARLLEAEVGRLLTTEGGGIADQILGHGLIV